MDKHYKLVEAFWWEGLAVGESKLSLALIGGAVLSKSLIQFPVDGRAVFPCSLAWGQTMEG